METLTMIRPAASWLLASTLYLASLAGCNSQPPGQLQTSQVAPAAGAPAATGLKGLSIRAELNGAAFGEADVKVFKPGQAEPIATGKTDAQGRLLLVSSNVIAPGGGNVIAPGGGNVIAPGGGNIIAAGAGNVIAAGGLNLIAAGAPLKVVASKGGQALASLGSAQIIAAGAGNIIAAGAGNVIAPGGGNVIAPGGGNYRVAALTREEVRLTVSTTLAVLALGDRLDGAAGASVKPDGVVLDKALEAVFQAFDKLSTAAEAALEASDSKQALIDQVVKALQPNGDGALPEAAAQQLTQSSAELKTAFQEAAALLSQAIQDAVAGGGTQPPGDATTDLTFGDAKAPGLDLPANGASPSPSGTDTTGGGGDGVNPKNLDAGVGVWGQFDAPTYVGTIFENGYGGGWSKDATATTAMADPIDYNRLIALRTSGPGQKLRLNRATPLDISGLSHLLLVLQGEQASSIGMFWTFALIDANGNRASYMVSGSVLAGPGSLYNSYTVELPMLNREAGFDATAIKGFEVAYSGTPPNAGLLIQTLKVFKLPS